MRNGVRVAALVDLHSFDDCVNAITVCYGIADPLNDKGATPFSSTVTVGRCIERFTLTRWAQKVCTVKAKVHLGRVSGFK